MLLAIYWIRAAWYCLVDNVSCWLMKGWVILAIANTIQLEKSQIIGYSLISQIACNLYTDCMGQIGKQSIFLCIISLWQALKPRLPHNIQIRWKSSISRLFKITSITICNALNVKIRTYGEFQNFSTKLD